MSKIQVFSAWDPAAQVWVVTDSNVPGLATEAATLDELLKKLKLMVPELLELNGQSAANSVPFSLISEVEEQASC